MGNNRPSRLRFNFGFLLEASVGTSRSIELDYPTIQLATDITLSPLKGMFIATRTSEGVYVEGSLHTIIKAECVRCLETAQVPLTFHLDELFYYPPQSAPDDTCSVFDGDTGFVDLGPLVRELSLLEVPMQPICDPDCQGLCMECGQNLNEGQCDCEEDNIDPRLAMLGAFLDN